MLDFENFADHTYNDNVITGGHNCVASGIIGFTKVDCGIPEDENAPGHSFAPPSMAPYSLSRDDGGNVTDLLGLMAWCMSAACVAGVIIVGTNMALQLRRGEMGEFGEHLRGMVLVVVACLLGATAGPLVTFMELV
jgi:hypothetical protein